MSDVCSFIIPTTALLDVDENSTDSVASHNLANYRRKGNFEKGESKKAIAFLVRPKLPFWFTHLPFSFIHLIFSSSPFHYIILALRRAILIRSGTRWYEVVQDCQAGPSKCLSRRKVTYYGHDMPLISHLATCTFWYDMT